MQRPITGIAHSLWPRRLRCLFLLWPFSLLPSIPLCKHLGTGHCKLVLVPLESWIALHMLLRLPGVLVVSISEPLDEVLVTFVTQDVFDDEARLSVVFVDLLLLLLLELLLNVFSSLLLAWAGLRCSCLPTTRFSGPAFGNFFLGSFRLRDNHLGGGDAAVPSFITVVVDVVDHHQDQYWLVRTPLWWGPTAVDVVAVDQGLVLSQ